MSLIINKNIVTDPHNYASHIKKTSMNISQKIMAFINISQKKHDFIWMSHDPQLNTVEKPLNMCFRFTSVSVLPKHKVLTRTES